MTRREDIEAELEASVPTFTTRPELLRRLKMLVLALCRWWRT